MSDMPGNRMVRLGDGTQPIFEKELTTTQAQKIFDRLMSGKTEDLYLPTKRGTLVIDITRMTTVDFLLPRPLECTCE